MDQNFSVIYMIKSTKKHNQMCMHCWFSFYLNAVMSIFGENIFSFMHLYLNDFILIKCHLNGFNFMYKMNIFRRFSNWIYHGIIEDPGQELFIEFVNYYLPKTKSFFDKAFVIKECSVPGFLKGWQHSILLCGKYSKLLKSYNPMVIIRNY